MSRRKSSAPSRFVFSDISDASSSSTTTFDLAESLPQDSVSHSKTKSSPSSSSRRKKVYREVPRSGVVLGDVTCGVQVNGLDGCNGDGVQFVLLVSDADPPVLEVSSSSEKAYLNVDVPVDVPRETFSNLLSRNYVWILKDTACMSEGTVNFSICVTPDKMPIAKAKNVAELFSRKTFPSYETKVTRNIECTEDFFREVQAHQKESLCLPDANVQHERLKPKLCPYQARAVRWMLLREGLQLQSQTADWQWSVTEKFSSVCGTTIYYNKYCETMFLEPLDFPPFPKGGILADEMGLGKTVTVIALVLNNPSDWGPELHEDEFILPKMAGGCKVNKVNVPSVKKSDPDYVDRIKEKNKETYMDHHEKLVHNKVSRGPALKRALNEWYETELAEYSASPRKKKTGANDRSVKCVCGDALSKKEEKCVQCPQCERLQHVKCVGYRDGYRYFCPDCWTKQKLVRSNATLIVSPSSIYQQWLDEVKRHVAPDAFPNGVVAYDGVRNSFVQPSVLASHDMVISTYAVLRAELNHAVQSESPRKLRNEERFLKRCSPLRQIRWWRLCLDEAQMVENDGSQINQMAKLIPAAVRWSVTGTPIQNSINDIFHLMDFLKVEPFTDKSLWQNLLYLPYVNENKLPLCSTLSRVFWRNSKEDVSGELIIPEQKVRYHFLKFSPLEQNFYMREHAASSCQFADGLRHCGLDATRTIDSLEKNLLAKLLSPLLNLRQACSHPMAVRGHKIAAKTGSMTLTELFKYLYGKTKVECEEDLRKYIAGLNGMAGIYCIKEDWPTAVDYYRRVLQITEEYKEKVHVDSLQRIHTLNNLADVLQHHGEGIPPTLRDESLRDHAKALEDKYMEKATGDVASERKALQDVTGKIEEMEANYVMGPEVWWVRIIHALTLDKGIEELTDKIATELLQNQSDNRKTAGVFIAKMSSPKSIEIMLRNWLKTVRENRGAALASLESASEASCDDLVDQAVDCHLRALPTAHKKKKCELCSCENVLLDYECSLFAVSRKVLKEEYEKDLDGARTKGSWKAHNSERVLRVVLAVGRTKAASEAEALRDGRNHINILDAMKKEFKQLRVVWMSLNHRVQARDEVSMCKLRLRLRYPQEPLPPKPKNHNLKAQYKAETIYIIERHEMCAQRMKIEAEMEVSKSEFKKKYGTLLYLGNLGKKENAKPEPCPICKSPFEDEWCVLQCGHSYCTDCIRTLLMRNAKFSVRCPVCREATNSADLSFVDLSGRPDDSDARVVGEHSTKVEAVVRTLLELKRSDDRVKVLVFSAWVLVLKVLAVALEENGITFRRVPCHNYQVYVKDFKDPKMNVTALLLPVSWGSKGLNLVEATHVFLVEPVMNPADELQALGRVHRIGQTRETFVHRFLISGTIEEKIHSAVSEAKDKWGKKKVTLEDLKNLFDIRNTLTQTRGADAEVG